MFLYIGNKHTSINKYKKRFIDEFCKLSCTFMFFFREFVTFYIFCSLVYQKLSDTDSKSMEYQSVWVVKGTVAVSAVLYPNNKQSLTICTKSTRIITEKIFNYPFIYSKKAEYMLKWIVIHSSATIFHQIPGVTMKSCHEYCQLLLPWISWVFQQVVLTPATHVMSHCFLQQTYINKLLLQLGLNLEI